MAFSQFPTDRDFFLIVLLISAILISVVEDFRRHKIPNLVTFPSLVLAVAYHSISGGLDGFFFSTGGLGLGIGFFIIPYLLGGMGAGDVKLMGAAGAIMGPKGILVASVLVYLAGGLCGAILLALNPKHAVSFLKRSWTTIKTFCITAQFIIIPPDKDEKPLVMRFAIPIAVGTLSYCFMKTALDDLVPGWLGL
jgi:prepilin peptidase CpaA